MAIKDKNGNVYKLRGPNPLMLEQRDWDRTQLTLINVGNWTADVIEDDKNGQRLVPVASAPKVKLGTETKIISSTQFLDDVQDEPVIVQEPVVAQPVIPVKAPEPVQDPPKVVIQADDHSVKLLSERGAEFHCAPVVGSKRFVDDLYGYTTERPIYGDKFIFDAIIVDISDFEIQFWCIREIANNSIVYRRVQQGGERWWKIISSEPKSNGHLVKAITSDINPDFS